MEDFAGNWPRNFIPSPSKVNPFNPIFSSLIMASIQDFFQILFLGSFSEGGAFLPPVDQNRGYKRPDQNRVNEGSTSPMPFFVEKLCHFLSDAYFSLFFSKMSSKWPTAPRKTANVFKIIICWLWNWLFLVPKT